MSFYVFYSFLNLLGLLFCLYGIIKYNLMFIFTGSIVMIFHSIVHLVYVRTSELLYTILLAGFIICAIYSLGFIHMNKKRHND